MNALETICWIHDELVQALDQVICEGVEMERIKIGTDIASRPCIMIDGHHRVFALHIEHQKRTDQLDQNGLPAYVVEPMAKWDDRWKDYVKMLTVKRAIGPSLSSMSNGELRMRYTAGLGIDEEPGSTWLEFEQHQPGRCPWTGSDGTIHEGDLFPAGRFITWRKALQPPIRMRVD